MFESERRDLAWVPRWSIVRVLRRQSVAEHSFYVCAYGLEIARHIGWPHKTVSAAVGDQRYALALYLLRHDETESFEGDMPGPTKRLAGYDPERLAGMARDRYGPPAACTTDMKTIKKAADLVDECMYLAGEMAMGNRTVAPVLENSRRRLEAAVDALPCAGVPDARVALMFELNETIDAEREAVKNIDGLRGV